MTTITKTETLVLFGHTLHGDKSWPKFLSWRMRLELSDGYSKLSDKDKISLLVDDYNFTPTVPDGSEDEGDDGEYDPKTFPWDQVETFLNSFGGDGEWTETEYYLYGQYAPALRMYDTLGDKVAMSLGLRKVKAGGWVDSWDEVRFYGQVERLNAHLRKAGMPFTVERSKAIAFTDDIDDTFMRELGLADPEDE